MRPRLRRILACAAVSSLAATVVWFVPARAASKSAARKPLTREVRARRLPGVGGGEAPGPLGEQDDRQPPRETQREPRQHEMHRAASFDGDVRAIGETRATRKRERPEREGPAITPVPFPGAPQSTAVTQPLGGVQSLSAPAPNPTSNFEGLDFATWGAGHPPDTNGDVGPAHYIQTVNTSIGIYNKNDGTRIAAFTFDTFMSQGHFGNLCDTDNFGDPVVLYDSFEDRWVITDFAFQLDASNNVVNPPGAFQCFAVSKSGDPVSGGWNYYWINTAGGLGDYPKFGIWPDGLYMSVNMFGYPAGASFQNPRLYALNKAQMYAGAPTIQVISFDAPSSEFTLLPANARLQTGMPPAGSPNYFASLGIFTNAIELWKFHVDWNALSASTLTGPFTAFTSTLSTLTSSTVPSPANPLDTLYPRTMVQNQYSNIGGVESLWDSHTVGGGAAGASSSQAAVRYYQVKVTGGTVEANASQAFTYSPDTTVNRFLPSVAVDRAGNMAIGYSATSATLNPSMRYAGRLAGDPANSLSQTETTLLTGGGSQSGTCGGATCTRWGDYSAMTLDPDGCTFWYTNEYYQVTGLNDRTRVFSFSLPGCTPIGTGTLSGTITAAVGGLPIAGATVALGNRTATTDAGGVYVFASLPAGTYPSLTASFPGYAPATVSSIAVPDGGSVQRNFALSTAPASACLIDTTQADFQTGVATNCDLATSPGDVTLLNAALVDQQNQSVTPNGFAVNATSWAGQTFTPAVTGQLTRADLDLFCSGCTGTTPNLTVSIRATVSIANKLVPTGADLATATIAGFSSGAGGFFSANFASPPTLTAGTRYAVIVRAVSNPSAGTYAYVCSCSGNGYSNSNPYANGQWVTSSNSGGSWSADSLGRDLGFVTYMKTGFPASGTFVSSTKDANPAAGGSAAWSTVSWTVATPASTTVRMQIAASSNVSGPFVFVGPDGTASTFFSNGGSLAQFTGKRYLKYQATLTTTNNTITPALNDVTVCFVNTPAAAVALAVSPASGIYGGTTTLSASLTTGGNGLSGKTVSFALLGSTVGSAVTNASGVATLAGISLAGINGATYVGGVTANFAGDASNQPASGISNLTVGRAAQTITFGAIADKSQGDPDFTVSATASSGLAVSFAASGQCTIAGNLVHLTGAGSCTITASQAGDTNFNAAPDVPQTFAIAATISPEVVAQALLNGANRLGPPLQHADGGWYFLASATDCGVAPPSPSLPPPSCTNLYGINGLGLLEAYRHNPANAALLQYARAAGDALVAIFAAQDPLARTRPVMQDVEFLGALSQTSGDATYMTTATDWFAVLVAQYPSAASRVDAIFATRDKQGFRTFGAWDAASLVRAARAVGNVDYATAGANRIVDRELDRVENGVLLKGWKYLTPGSAPADDPYGYDYTLMSEGSLLASIFDLPGFSAKRSEYLSFLLGQQDPAGTWDGGDLQMTAYIVKGLIALGDASANNAIGRAENFFAAQQQPNGGWPYYVVGSATGPEYTEVDSEVMQALSALYNTPSGSQVASQPSPLAALRFSTVAAVGTTTVTAVDPATTGTVPAGYAPASVGYHAATTARLGTAASDGVTVCLWAPTIADPIAFANLRLLHNENGALVDRTVAAPDFAARTICGRVTSLGPLALAMLDPKPLTITSITSSVSSLPRPRSHVELVTLSVVTEDLVDPAPRCSVTEVAGTPRDWRITGPLTVLFRGEADKHRDRSYVVTVRCTDASGNAASAQTTVVLSNAR